MKRELKKHKLAYLTLFSGFVIFLLFFLGVWPNRDLQRFAVICLMFFYFVWGVVTHVKTTTFTKRVAYEYAAVSILGGIFLLILTL